MFVSFSLHNTSDPPTCFHKRPTLLQKVESQLAASFDMKDLGDLHYFLEIEVVCTREGMLISQQHHVLSMLLKFSMMECKSVSTSLDRNEKHLPNSGMACDPNRLDRLSKGSYTPSPYRTSFIRFS